MRNSDRRALERKVSTLDTGGFLLISYHTLIGLRGMLHQSTFHCPGTDLDTPPIWIPFEGGGGRKAQEAEGRWDFFVNVVISENAKIA